MKRIFDFLLAIATTILLVIPIILTVIAVRITSKGSVLYWSDRIGRNNEIFKMPKFRSMRIDAPTVASLHRMPILRDLTEQQETNG